MLLLMKTGQILFLAILLLIVLTGCSREIVCNKPYLQVGKDCCMDANNNKICDNDENCYNGLKDQDETDVDCGGKKCSSCEINKRCMMPEDCKSTYCRKGVCQKDAVDSVEKKSQIVCELEPDLQKIEEQRLYNINADGISSNAVYFSIQGLNCHFGNEAGENKFFVYCSRMIESLNANGDVVGVPTTQQIVYNVQTNLYLCNDNSLYQSVSYPDSQKMKIWAECIKTSSSRPTQTGSKCCTAREEFVLINYTCVQN